MAANQSFSGFWRNLNPIQIRIVLSSLAFSFYFQGLDLYFYITSLINFKPTWMTGLYQIGLLGIFLFCALSIPASKKNLFNLEFVDFLYLGFLALVFVDLFLIARNSIYATPENLNIYFLVYGLSLVLGRCLIFSQFKLVVYFTNAISIITSLLLFSQFLTGSASYANNATRLVNGLAANPINTGYIGAYAFLTSFTLGIKSNSFLFQIIWIFGGIFGLAVCFLSGTRSANIFVMLGLTIVAFAWLITIINNPVNKFKSTTLQSQLIKICLTSGFLFMMIIIFSNSSFLNFNNISILMPFKKAWMRISQVFLIGSDQVTDHSITERYSLYERGFNVFAEHPVFGGQVYSAGSVHNAFLQSASDLGILGIITFVIPFVYFGLFYLNTVVNHAIKMPGVYWKSDLWMVDSWAGFVLFESGCLFSFHGDPYRTYISICGIGILIAFTKLSFVRPGNKIN